MGWAVMAAIVGTLGCGRLAFDPTSGCPDPSVEQEVSIPGRYVAPSGGSDTNPGTEDMPFATIAHALMAVATGEAVILMDGVYSERLVVDVNDRTVVAANDGRAIFDGGGTTMPCEIVGTNLVIEGVHCRNGIPAAFNVAASADVTVRRVTAHTAVSQTVFRIYDSARILLEDVAAWGPASSDYFVTNSSFVTLRRCWARWETTDDMYSSVLVLSAGASDSIVENCVLMSNAPYDPIKATVGLHVGSVAMQSDRNRLLGNVVYGMPNWGTVVSTETSLIRGNRFVDTVLMTSGGGFYQRADSDFGIERLTSVEMQGDGMLIQAHTTEPKDVGFEIAGYVRDSVLGVADHGFNVDGPYITNVVHTNNTLYSVSEPWRGDITQDPSETVVDPNYDKATYGLGAYLIQNDLGTGAEVLMRYEGGVLTGQSLWPWPMEERILRESGTSVTYESGGGIWRTLPETATEACP